MTTDDKIRGRKIGVIGMGRSGMAAALLASNLGGEVFVSDSGTARSLADQIIQLQRRRIPFETDGHTSRVLASDYIIISPGVPEIDIVRQAHERGIPIFSELEFASWVCRGRIVAVTGSNGKTTTTTLIGEMLSAAEYDTFVCGNIGLPFSQVADKINEAAIAVVEVSTFQLERIADFRPHVALILNLSPDHLDRHGSFEAYKRLKYRITENQTAEDYFILNADDRETAADNPDSAARRLFFTIDSGKSVEHGAFVKGDVLYAAIRGQHERIATKTDILIPGPHNLQNAAAAAAAATVLGVPAATLGEVLANFRGVEHRLEKVGRVAGIDFVNDSKATNVDSVSYALRSIDSPICLIAGGRFKGGSLDPIVEYGRGRIKSLILIGEAKAVLFDALGKKFPAVFADSLEDAVLKGFEMARPGDTVLLSPACASFDMFDDYEHRGRVFKETVAGLKAGRKTNETVSD